MAIRVHIISDIYGTGTRIYPHMTSARDAARRRAMLDLEALNDKHPDETFSLRELKGHVGYFILKDTPTRTLICSHIQILDKE